MSRVCSHILGAGAGRAVSQGTRGEDVDWQMDQADATGRTEVTDAIGHKFLTESIQITDIHF